jgi:surface polysaccharide O-acyltransferase-like enzyme
MDISNRTRNVPLAYLKAFLILLVVAHHSLIAYTTYAPPPGKSLDTKWMLWTAFPVVDHNHWAPADLLVGFNDTFFMSLFFFVSGLFAWRSLARKGTARFLSGRGLRLGVPFLFAAGLLAPLAFYPAYLSTGSESSFWSQWFALGVWPAGPAWFLWVLLAFGSVIALITWFAPNWGSALGRLKIRWFERPATCFAALLVLSALAYMPMSVLFGPAGWTSFGPFFFQTSRIAHYAAYFAVGAVMSAYGLDRSALAVGGKLARRWPLWVVVALAAFGMNLAVSVTIQASLAHGGPSGSLSTFGNFVFVLSCAASSFAFLAVFLRFAKNSNRIADSLSANAYGIYICHYFCVTWLQFALLNTSLPAEVKALLVFAGAVALSWGMSAGLRQLSIVRQVL